MKKLIFDIIFDILMFILCVFLYRNGHQGWVIAVIGFRVLLLSMLSTINEAIAKLDKGQEL